MLARFIPDQGLFGLRLPPRCRLKVVPRGQLPDEFGKGLCDQAVGASGSSGKGAGGPELDGKAADDVVGLVAGKESRIQEAVHTAGGMRDFRSWVEWDLDKAGIAWGYAWASPVCMIAVATGVAASQGPPSRARTPGLRSDDE